MVKILYVERSPGPFISIEKVFREIADGLPERFARSFQQMPYGWNVWGTIRNLLFFRPARADIYHITGHVHYIALRLPPERTVLSIMDVRFALLEKGLRRWVLKKLYLDWPLKRMRYVTTISEQVRSEIVELTGCDPDRIRVLDLPLLQHLQVTAEKPFEEGKPTILQVGTMANKNLPRLAEALNGIDCKLIVVGELAAEQRESIELNGIEMENHVGVSDEKIRELYDLSDIVAFCSTYEGFGLPIIEAQAMRKPVVTSDIEPMRSVAGEGACLVDPFSVESIRRGVVSLIEDPERRRECVEAGQRNIERFRTTEVANQYARLYDDVMAALQ